MCFWAFHDPFPFKCNFMCLFSVSFCLVHVLPDLFFPCQEHCRKRCRSVWADTNYLILYCTCFSGKASFGWQIWWLDRIQSLHFCKQYLVLEVFLCWRSLQAVNMEIDKVIFTFFEADEVYGTLALDDVKISTFLVHFCMHCYECIQTEVSKTESVQQLPQLKRPHSVENG